MLEACARRDVSFIRTLTFGRQQLTDGSYAEPFLRSLGAISVDSMDASNFEGATIIADFNRPLPQELRRSYSVVFDGGTLEHVFDIATALRSCLDLVELSGHYIASSPANNWPGHGFYQFSPELVFRMLSPQSGFRMRAAFIVELRKTPRWYAIPDPAVVGARVHWVNRVRTQLVVVAQRVELLDLTTFVPQQSDYVSRWRAFEQPSTDAVSYGPKGPIKGFLWGITPPAVQRMYETARQRNKGEFDSGTFTPVDSAAIADHIV